MSRDCSSTAQSPSNNVCLLHQPPRIPEKVVIIAIAESHRGSRKFSAAGLCQPCRTPGSISSIISPTRSSQGSGDCCGDRLILSLPRKDSDTSKGLTDTSMTSADKFILSCQEAAAVWDREGRQRGAGSVDYQSLPRSLIQLS